MLDRTRLLLRDATAQLRREPVAAAFVALTIAIGVAASAAIFTVVRSVILRPLPYRDAESLVAIQELRPDRGLDPGGVAFANLPRYRAMPAVEALTAFSYAEAVVSGDTDAERLIAANVDGELFRTLGVRPQVGRGIEGSDAVDAPARVVVLSSAVWTRRYGRDKALVGRSITIDGDPYTVIGIADDAFEFPRSPAMDRDVEIWMPRRPPPPMMVRRGSRDLTAIARLRRGTGITEFQTQLAVQAVAARQDNAPLNAGWQARAVGLRDMVVGRVKSALLLLSICVGMLLLIACVNASAVMLARTTVRRVAYGVRLALGSTPSQLIGVVVAETALLAAAALLLGVPLSAVARTMLLRIAPVAVPRQNAIAWTGTTALFAALVATVAALVAVLAPAAWLGRMDVKTLMDGARTSFGSRRRTLALAAFLLAQAALGTILLAATLTLYSRYIRLNAVNPGFEAAGVTTATIPMRGMRYRDGGNRWNLTNQLLERVRAIPEVQSAAVASLMPLSGGLMSASYKVRDGATDSSATAALRAVSPGFFATLGIALRQGRLMGSTDGAQAPPVVVVNDAFVKQALGGRAPIAAVVTLTPPGADEPRDFTIVGVVANAKEKDLLSADSPIVYLSDAQASFPHTVLAFRSRGAAPIDAVRRALRDLDASLALDDVGPLGAKVRATYGLQFFQLNVLSMFAVSALLLIAIGIYGAVSFVAASDAQASAIRLALGASPRQITLALLRRTARWSISGCVVGLVVIAALQPLLGLVSGAADFAAIVSGAIVVLIVALLATGRPSLRASRVEALSAMSAQ